MTDTTEEWRSKSGARRNVSSQASRIKEIIFRNSATDLLKDPFAGERTRYLAALAVNSYLARGLDSTSRRSSQALFRIFSERDRVPDSVAGIPAKVRYIMEANGEDLSHSFRCMSLLGYIGFISGNPDLNFPYNHNRLVDYLFSLNEEIVADHDIAQQALGSLQELLGATFHVPISDGVRGEFLSGSRIPIAHGSDDDKYNVIEIHPNWVRRKVPLEKEVARVVTSLEEAKPLVANVLRPENADLFKLRADMKNGEEK